MGVLQIYENLSHLKSKYYNIPPLMFAFDKCNVLRNMNNVLTYLMSGATRWYRIVATLPWRKIVEGKLSVLNQFDVIPSAISVNVENSVAEFMFQSPKTLPSTSMSFLQAFKVFVEKLIPVLFLARSIKFREKISSNIL